jgi:hypothetical protein
MGAPITKTTMVDGKLTISKEKTYDWPELSKERIFDMVDLRIRAGTTGAPDGIEEKEGWLKVLPMVTSLSIQIQNLQARGMDYEHIRSLLRETLLRYDDRIDSNLFMPNVAKQADGFVDFPHEISMHRLWEMGADKQSKHQHLKEETVDDARSEKL